MRAGSLCTGIGGLDLAVEQHFAADMVWCAEYEPQLDPIIQREFGPVLNLRDITTVSWDELEPVDVLSAGYPCQPFSHAGNRKGTNDARHLWPYVAAAVRVLRPRWVVLENVAGHLSLGFDVVLGDLAAAGFNAEWCVLRASDVGAPHQRARLFIVATDSDQAGLQGSQPTQRRFLSPRRGGATAHADIFNDGAPQRNQLDTSTGTQRRSRNTHISTRSGRSDAQVKIDDDGRGSLGIEWGDYESAIGRWEFVLGRPAPRPVDDAGRLSPAFVEWMMGYPAGWVDGLTRTQALKALGNAVVPQQGLAALRELVPLEQEAVA